MTAGAKGRRSKGVPGQRNCFRCRSHINNASHPGRPLPPSPEGSSFPMIIGEIGNEPIRLAILPITQATNR